METAVKAWLRRKRTVEAPMRLLCATGLIIGGWIVLAITAYLCFFSFLIAWHGVAALYEMITNQHLPRWPWRGVGIFTGAFIVLVFMRSTRSTWWERGDIPKGVWLFVGLWGRPRQGDTVGNPSATAVATGKFGSDFLFTAPRMFVGAWRTFRESVRLWQLDVEPLARVLAAVMTSHRPLALEELAGRLLPACDFARIEHQLRHLDGVVFLEQGLSLTSDLRLELIGACHALAGSHH